MVSPVVILPIKCIWIRQHLQFIVLCILILESSVLFCCISNFVLLCLNGSWTVCLFLELLCILFGLLLSVCWFSKFVCLLLFIQFLSVLFLATLVTVWALVPSSLGQRQLEFRIIFRDSFRDRERVSGA